MSREADSSQDQGAVARYVAIDAGDSASPEEPGYIEIFARCDAVLAVAPRLADSSELAWAFAEANLIARSAPPAANLPWYRRVAIAWSAAGLSAAATAVLATLMLAPPGENAAQQPRGIAVPPMAFTPIVVPQEMASDVAAIDPVTLLADAIPVDSRSIVVLPFVGVTSSPGTRSGAIEATADRIYEMVVRQLAAIPGIYVIDPRTAAVYSDVELQPEQIALYLGVRGVVQGRVDSDGNTVSLDLLFTDAAGAGYSIDRDFERPIAEVAMLQNDAALSVLDALIGRSTNDPSLN